MKKTHKLIILTIALVILAYQAQCLDSVSQDFEIYQQGETHIVRGKIDLKEHFSGSSASEAIQFALNNLGASGGTVYIHTGIYLLNKQIDIPSHATLTGSGNGSRLIFGNNHVTGIAISCRAADNAVIKNLSIQAELSNVSARIGVQIDSCGLTSVEKVTCIGMQEHGIVLSNYSFLCTIDACKIGGTGKSGILIKNLFKGGRGGDWVPSQVSNCIVYACGKGIECLKSLVINISDCQVYQTKSHGFHIHTQSNAVLVTGCRTYQITGGSVVVENSHEINLSSNIFSWSTEEGIILNNVRWGSVVGNNIIDIGSVNLFDPEEDSLIKADPKRPFVKKYVPGQEITNYTGILLKNQTMGITITGNSIFNWHVAPPMRYGIEEDTSCVSNLISSNNINYCIEGISANGKETLVKNNKIYAEKPFYRVNSNKPFIKGIIKDYQYFDTRLIQEFINEINKVK